MTEVLATFNSADPKLRLVRTPIRTRMNERGEREPLPGKTYTFKRGALKVTDAMEQKDPGLLEWLRNHRSLGIFFHEPDTPAPSRVGTDSSEVLKRIMRLTAEGDADGIAAILVSERNDQSRPEVMAAAEEGIELTNPDSAPEPEDRPIHEERFPHRPPGPHKGPEAGEPEPEPSATEEASKLADKYGLGIAEIDGSGKDGRVTKPDVERHIEDHGLTEPVHDAGEKSEGEARPHGAEDVEEIYEPEDERGETEFVDDGSEPEPETGDVPTTEEGEVEPPSGEPEKPPVTNSEPELGGEAPREPTTEYPQPEDERE